MAPRSPHASLTPTSERSRLNRPCFPSSKTRSPQPATPCNWHPCTPTTTPPRIPNRSPSLSVTTDSTPASHSTTSAANDADQPPRPISLSACPRCSQRQGSSDRPSLPAGLGSTGGADGLHRTTHSGAAGIILALFHCYKAFVRDIAGSNLVPSPSVTHRCDFLCERTLEKNWPAGVEYPEYPEAAWSAESALRWTTEQ